MMEKIVVITYLLLVLGGIGHANEISVIYNPGPTMKAYAHILGDNLYGYSDDESDSHLDGNPLTHSGLAWYQQCNPYWKPIDQSLPSTTLVTCNWTCQQRGFAPGWDFWFDTTGSEAICSALNNNEILGNTLREVTAFRYQDQWASFIYHPSIKNTKITFDAKARYFDAIGAADATTAYISVAFQVGVPNGTVEDIYDLEILLFNGGVADYDNNASNDFFWSGIKATGTGVTIYQFLVHADKVGLSQLPISTDPDNPNDPAWRSFQIDFTDIMINNGYFDAYLPAGVEWDDCRLLAFEGYASSRGYNIQMATKNISIKAQSPELFVIPSKPNTWGHNAGTHTVSLNNAFYSTINWKIDQNTLPNWIHPSIEQGSISARNNNSPNSVPLVFSFDTNTSTNDRAAIIRFVDIYTSDHLASFAVTQKAPILTKLHGPYLPLLDTYPWDLNGPYYDEDNPY
ncbi:MAG: hypothetical protein CSA22_09630 [Deltaproteobacteria bacterium]|nr:MAG: hypothetical protein CSA22_09630 [Deltaproteobacteria bacterium]